MVDGREKRAVLEVGVTIMEGLGSKLRRASGTRGEVSEDKRGRERTKRALHQSNTVSINAKS